RENYLDEFGNQNNMTSDKTGNNPYWILNKNKNGNKLNRFIGSTYLEYKANDWLTFSNNFGMDMFMENRLGYVRQGTAGDLEGSYITTDIFQKRFNNDLMATAQKTVNEDWNLRAMLGTNFLDRRTDVSGIAGNNLLLDAGEGIFRPGNAKSVIASRSFSNHRLVSIYGELAAGYRDMLFLSVTGRNDWSSALVYTGNFSYFYPS